MAVKVIKPGLLTTIQDLGRPGYYHLGIPIGGAMDRYALTCANLLVGNPEGAACLEAVFMGPELEIRADVTMAVTGAHMTPLVDGVEQPLWTTFDAKKGQILTFDYLKAGARAYIAFQGGVDVPLYLGSRSTYVIGALGGVDGKPVAAGDELAVGEVSSRTPDGRTVPAALRRLPGSPAEIRVIPGLYNHRITRESEDRFYAETWTVAPEADRMGYRFRGGSPLDFIEREQPFGAGSDPSNITDACYPYGSIQVPGGTEPIILHRDAVSGGGYMMIGTVISADMDLIGQMQPNTPTRFVRVDMDSALAARAENAARLGKVKEALG